MCFSRRWGTVGSDGWTQTNTQVVCNDLGYESDSGIVCGYIWLCQYMPALDIILYLLV